MNKRGKNREGLKDDMKEKGKTGNNEGITEGIH